MIVSITSSNSSKTLNLLPAIRVSSIVLILTSALLFTDMLSGMLRYYLVYSNLEYLIYLPKIACLIFVFPKMIKNLKQRPFFYLLLLVLISQIIGMFHQVNIKSQLFTFFLIIPFLFGFVSAQYIRQKELFFIVVMFIIWIVTVLGIYADILLDFPWTGFTYTIEGVNIEAARKWTTMGLERISGFSRMSSAAAFYLVCSALFLVIYIKSLWLKMVLVVTTLPALLATTNKAGIFCFTLSLFFSNLAKIPSLLKFIIYGLAIIVITLPISASFISYDFNFSGPIEMLLLSSFADRLETTWPNFIAKVTKYGNPILGIGFGGVGTAVKYFSEETSSGLDVGDNFALYLFGCCGIIAFALFFYLAKVTIRLYVIRDKYSIALATIMVAILAASLTTDIIESQIFAFMLGLAITTAYINKPYSLLLAQNVLRANRNAISIR